MLNVSTCYETKSYKTIDNDEDTATMALQVQMKSLEVPFLLIAHILLATSGYSRIVIMIRCVDTKTTASESIPEYTLVGTVEAVHIRLDPCVTGCQD